MSIPQGSKSHGPRKRLPVNPSIEHLRKQAKRLAGSRKTALSTVQQQLAREYGCRHWAELTRVVETMSRGADQLENVTRTMEPLPKAARGRDLDAVRRILGSGQFTVHDLDAALAHAAWYGGDDFEVLKVRKAIFDLVLDHGADPNGQYGSNYGPLVFGCGECLDPHGLRWLLEAGADVAFAPVETKYGRHCALSYVLGTYTRGRNERKHEMIDLLLAAGAFVPSEVTPEILAIHRGDAVGLGKLVEADATLIRRTFPGMPYGNMSLSGASLLHCAVEFGEIECCEELLKRGADINIRAEVIDGIGGQTPVFHAIATVGGGSFYMLEHLARRAGPAIDMNIRATFRFAGKPHARPVTPVEYAEEASSEETVAWRRADGKEVCLLRELQRRGEEKRRGSG